MKFWAVFSTLKTVSCSKEWAFASNRVRNLMLVAMPRLAALAA
jgi:hypothetical protein